MKITVDEYLKHNGINLRPHQVGFPCPTKEEYDNILRIFDHESAHTGDWTESRRNNYLVIYQNNKFHDMSLVLKNEQLQKVTNINILSISPNNINSLLFQDNTLFEM